jgi:hypothetical protein
VQQHRPIVVFRHRRHVFVIVHRRFPTGTLAFTGSSGAAAIFGLVSLLVGGALACLDPDRRQGYARLGRRRPRKSLHVTLPPH